MYDSIFPTFYGTVIYLLFRTSSIAPVPSTEEFSENLSSTLKTYCLMFRFRASYAFHRQPQEGSKELVNVILKQGEIRPSCCMGS